MPIGPIIGVAAVVIAVGAVAYYMKKRKGSDPDLVVCESKGVVPEPLDS